MASATSTAPSSSTAKPAWTAVCSGQVDWRKKHEEECLKNRKLTDENAKLSEKIEALALTRTELEERTRRARAAAQKSFVKEMETKEAAEGAQAALTDAFLEIGKLKGQIETAKKDGTGEIEERERLLAEQRTELARDRERVARQLEDVRIADEKAKKTMEKANAKNNAKIVQAKALEEARRQLKAAETARKEAEEHAAFVHNANLSLQTRVQQLDWQVMELTSELQATRAAGMRSAAQRFFGEKSVANQE